MYDDEEDGKIFDWKRRTSSLERTSDEGHKAGKEASLRGPADANEQHYFGHHSLNLFLFNYIYKEVDIYR